jgi:mRNA interferase RelE/StbE
MGSYWRYRVGDVRVICDIRDEELLILVIEVGHRREVYRTK